MIKIAHECPLNIFEEVQSKTDYDYCLAHLYDEVAGYREKFLEAKSKGREILLDTSVFELGEAFDPKLYIEIIKELKPDWYIVPDILEDCERTKSSYLSWTSTHNKLPGKKIGVIQGKNYQELTDCYRYFLKLGVDKIGVSFDYSYYETDFALSPIENYPTKFHKWMSGRQRFLLSLLSEKFYDPKVPLHLLGCSLPQEFSLYKSDYFEGSIDSLDTSNPVVHGIQKIPYRRDGLDNKETVKLFTLINYIPYKDQRKIVFENIDAFRNLVVSY